MNPRPLFLAALVSLALATNPLLAHEHEHEHGHDHDMAATSLQLNNGEKWQTDAPLRAAMGQIRNAMTDAHPGIHAGTLPDDDFTELANQVRAQVANMVANCQLPADADAQLHIVLGQLLNGATQMAGDSETATRKDGAHVIFGALTAYGEHFNDPDFQPIVHMH